MRRLLSIVAATLMLLQFSNVASAQTMKKSRNGTYVVNTTEIASDVKGLKGPTPVKIYIKSNKIIKVIALKNMETPSFFVRAENGILPVWKGMKVNKAMNIDVDAVSGATYSSKALIANVKKGLKYYKEHK
jgi:electron transport complex protein RnfG